jgi:hypothetical protein
LLKINFQEYYCVKGVVIFRGLILYSGYLQEKVPFHAVFGTERVGFLESFPRLCFTMIYFFCFCGFSHSEMIPQGLGAELSGGIQR